MSRHWRHGVAGRGNSPWAQMKRRLTWAANHPLPGRLSRAELETYRQPAVDGEHMAVHIGRRFGSEEDHCAPKLRGLGPASGGRAALDPRGESLVLEERGVEL